MQNKIADFYDIMMGEVDYDAWIKLLNKLLKPHLKGNAVLEIGCGTGEIAVRLQESGYKVKALDYSESMIRIAKSKYSEISFEKADMRSLDEREAFDGVVAVFDTLNYLHSLDELKTSFENIKKSLKSKGVFLFDVLNRRMIENMFEVDSFADDKEKFTVIWKHNYNNISELDEITISFFVRGEENNYTRYDERFVKKIFSQKEIKKIAEDTGFNILYREISTGIAGPRIVYLLQRVD